MKLQIQPNHASCLATSFAIVLDIPVEKIFTLLGHDGTEVSFPNRNVPQSYRGFHIAELTWICYLHDRAIIELPRTLAISHDYITIVEHRPPYSLFDFLLKYPAVMTNGSHAVAWDGQTIFDPAGKEYTDYTISHLIENFDIFYVFIK